MRRRLSREEAGFTLAELMVTMTIMILVLFALYSIFDMSMRVFTYGNDRVEVIENARLGLEKMEREIRAAYPYNKGTSPPDLHLLGTMEASRITFGNDGGAGDRVIDPATEEITYTASASGPPYTLHRRIGGGVAQPVMENIGSFEDGAPGLRFEYLKHSGADLVAASTEAEVEVVRVTVVAQKNEHRQEVSTAVDLRNRE